MERQGHKTAAEFMAAKSGSTVGAASESLSTSNKLSDLPAVEQAMRDGELSQAQVNVIADAARQGSA